MQGANLCYELWCNSPYDRCKERTYAMNYGVIRHMSGQLQMFGT